MKKLVLSTLAACVSMAFASAYAESTTSKEPIRLAQAQPSDTQPSGPSPTATKQRPKREPKEPSSRVKDPAQPSDAQPSGTSPTATKQRPKREPKERSSRVQDPAQPSETGGASPAPKARSSTKDSKEMAPAPK